MMENKAPPGVYNLFWKTKLKKCEIRVNNVIPYGMNMLSYAIELQIIGAQRKGSEQRKAHQRPEKCLHRGGRSLAGP